MIVMSDPTERKSLNQFAAAGRLNKKQLRGARAMVTKKLEIVSRSLETWTRQRDEAARSESTLPGALAYMDNQIAAIANQVAEYQRMLKD